MSKKLQLTINDPCHENWDQMTPADKGRFCASCQKQVVDFTHMSDREVAAFFKKPSTGSVCGRFMNDQLDRAIDIPKKRIPWVKYFFTIALPTFLFTKLSAQKVMGKVAPPAPRTDTVQPNLQPLRLGRVSKNHIEPVCTPVMGNAMMITKPAVADTLPKFKNRNGYVINSSGEPVAFATVLVKGSRQGVSTGLNGRFTIQAATGGELLVSTVSGTETFTVGPETDMVLRLKTTMKVEAFVVTAGAISYSVGTPAGINGTVVDENGAPIPFANFHPKRNGVTPLMADQKGHFTYDGIWNSRKQEFTVTAPGYISQTITMARNTKDQKVILKAEKTTLTTAIQPMFRIHPNPVIAGESIHLTCTELAEGYYTYRLVSLGGQVLQEKKVWIDADARLLSFETPRTAAGNYVVSLTEEKTGRRYGDMIVLQ